MAACSARPLGRCVWAFTLALVFDVVGLVLILVGIFAQDLAFYDFLIYTGAIIIFLSIIWWLFWFMGNISDMDTKYDCVRGPPRPVLGQESASQQSNCAQYHGHLNGRGGHINQSFSSERGVKVTEELPGHVLTLDRAYRQQLRNNHNDTMATPL